MGKAGCSLTAVSECRCVRVDMGAVAVGLEAPAACVAARFLTATTVEDDHGLSLMDATLCQPRSSCEGDASEGNVLAPRCKHDPVERPGEREVVLRCSGMRAKVGFDDHRRCPVGLGGCQAQGISMRFSRKKWRFRSATEAIKPEWIVRNL